MGTTIHNRLTAILLAAFVAVGATAVAVVTPSDLQYETVNGVRWSYVVENGKAKVTNWNMNPAIPSSTTGAVAVPDKLGGFTVTAIGSYAFYKISGITSLTIPEGVETIDFYACRYCTGLESISLPSTLTTMGDAVFFGCESLRAGAIPDSVTSMGRDIFWGCKAMESVRFSANVTTLGAMTCYDCDSLTEAVIPYGVTYIGVSAFSSCDNLRSIDIPATATNIDNYAFNKCPKLESLDLPEGMTAIRCIFSSCVSLATVEIPSSVTSIDGATFSGCTNMTSITVAAGNSSYKSVDGALYDQTGETLVEWPKGLAPPASIPAGVKRIGECVFSGRRDLTAIEIPEGVEHIGTSAFDMCVNLASANLPTTIKTIGDRAFFGCPLISHAEFYDGFESVGEKAFSRTGVASLTFPASTAVIGASAFRECASLQSLSVLSPTCSIRSYAFADCPRLVSVNIAEGASVSGNAFGDPPTPDDPPVVPSDTTDPVETEDELLPSDVQAGDFLLRFDCTSRYDRNSIYTILGMDGHYIRGGDMRDETRTDFMGRSCIWLHTYKQCMSGWFSINQTRYYEKSVFENSYPQSFTSVGDYQVPELFETIGVAFRLYSTAPCPAIQDPETKLPIYGTIWKHELYERSESLPGLSEEGLGAVIHIDDKMWLRYSEYDDGGVCKTNWQVCAGFVDASSNIVERVVELRSAVEGRLLPAPINRWTAVRVDAENGVSPFGLALRIYIGGVPAASAEDGQTTFRARPSATDRNGIAAFGVGGEAYLDDITFYVKARNPLNGVAVNAAGRHLEERDVKTLAAIMGIDALAGVSHIDLNECDGEPDDAALTCIRLGITPKEIEHTPSGDCAMLYFQNPTVTITDVDFSSRTITGKVVASGGTRVAAPPMPYMFGLTEIRGLESGMPSTNEYGNSFSRGEEGFSVDLSDYMSSNGVFTLHFPELVAPNDKPSFFKVTLKEYDHK